MSGFDLDAILAAIEAFFNTFFATGGAIVNKIWNVYHIGTVCAFISAIVVLVTDFKLIKQFMASGHKFKAWLRLLLHTALRVLMTVCVYYGPVWTIQTGWRMFKYITLNLWHLVLNMIKIDRYSVMYTTTGIIILAFVIVTVIALIQYANKHIR